MKIAVYAGSFDPVTNGHLWMIEAASKLFDKLIVTVGQNADKECAFSLNERLDLLREITKNFSNVEVTSFDKEFLINYAKEMKANYIVRGIRNTLDYEYERTIRYVNSDLCSEIETVFLIPPRNYAEISSSLVKGLIGAKGWENVIKNYLPKAAFELVLKHNKLI